MDLLEKKVQALTNSFLQSDVPNRIPLVLGMCFWGQMGSTGQINLVCSTCDSLGSCAGAGGWGGQFLAQKEAAIEGI